MKFLGKIKEFFGQLAYSTPENALFQSNMLERLTDEAWSVIQKLDMGFVTKKEARAWLFEHKGHFMEFNDRFILDILESYMARKVITKAEARGFLRPINHL